MRDFNNYNVEYKNHKYRTYYNAMLLHVFLQIACS